MFVKNEPNIHISFFRSQFASVARQYDSNMTHQMCIVSSATETKHMRINENALTSNSDYAQ